ncbi:unnamed protein product [Orchesella dallaii]|uniref:RING-type domain-containing protein n=1 Tax=Orchesella dallaii TaxID=48710 RepID=A0ABP1QIY2_9HEXA
MQNNDRQLGNNNNWDCSICWNLLSELPEMPNTNRNPASPLCTTPCGHAFHRACLEGWLRRENGNCPTCRREILDEDLYPLFLQVENSQREVLNHEIQSLKEKLKQETERADSNELKVFSLEKARKDKEAERQKTSHCFANSRDDWQDWRLLDDFLVQDCSVKEYRV